MFYRSLEMVSKAAYGPNCGSDLTLNRTLCEDS